MSKLSNVRFLKNKEIKIDKWNEVIDRSDNSLIYAHACYLDIVSPKWAAFIYKDYEYVMPLPVNKKFGLSLLVQPIYCQQLGIFPNPDIEIVEEFIDAIKNQFKYVSINFNSNNKIHEVLKEEVTSVQNYILNLGLTYDEIVSSYSTHTKRHLKKACSHNLTIQDYLKPSEFLKFKEKNQDSKIYKNGLKILRNILPELLPRDRGSIYGVYDENNELCAAGVFIFDRERIIYLNGVSSKRGKELDAMYFLIDNVLRKNSGENIFFDFEGSKIPGVARFFEGFGASKEFYYNYKYNKLPFPLSWVKK